MSMFTRDQLVCVRERQGGKTTRLVQWLAETPRREDGFMPEVRVGVFITESEAMRVLREAREQGFIVESWQFLSLDDAVEPGALRAVEGDIVVGLDNLDLMLHDLSFRALPWPVRFITITGEAV